MTGPTRAPATLAADLAALSEQATPGEWEVFAAPATGIGQGERFGIIADRCLDDEPHTPCDHETRVALPEYGFDANAAFIARLANAFRDGKLVAVDDARVASCSSGDAQSDETQVALQFDRAGHLVTLDAALDWVAEQLADPEMVEVVARAINAHDNAVIADTNFERLGGTYAEQSGVAITAALAALRDRAAAPARTTTKEQP